MKPEMERRCGARGAEIIKALRRRAGNTSMRAVMNADRKRLLARELVSYKEK